MIVLDAAAVVDVLLGQRDTDWVLDQLQDQEVYAPAHQPAEVLSAIARLQRAGHLSSTQATDAVADAAALEQHLVAPTPAHLRRALELQERVRVLDGLYVALAEELECPVVTTDRRLAGSSPPCEVRAPVG